MDTIAIGYAQNMKLLEQKWGKKIVKHQFFHLFIRFLKFYFNDVHVMY
jgi:hypothetical protein